MPFKPLLRAFAAALLLAASGVIASAQVTQINGKVTLKQADGTVAPVAGAQVDIYRTDIKWEDHIKTNKKGEFQHAGIPFVGTYTIAVSAPGAQPTYRSGLRLSQQPEQNFELNPGDGSRLTLDQIKASDARSGNAAASAVSAEDRKKALAAAEAAKAEAARVEENNKKVENLNSLLKSANDLLTAKKYDEALAIYDQGIQQAPDEPVFYRNKAIAQRARGVDLYNTALRNKDSAGKDSARNDLKGSVESAEKAVTLARASVAKNGAAANGAAGASGAAAGNPLLPFLEARQESYRLALATITPVDTEAAVKAFQEYIEAETDPSRKMKAQASLGDSLFASGKIDEAITTYRQVLSSTPDNLDAMYGLGIALAAKVTDATKDAPLINEARETLQKFISKAPDTNPHKQEAIASVQYLDETMKAASSKPEEKPKSGRRKP